MKVMAEDRRQVETRIDGQLYRARNGFFEIDNPRHAAAHLRSGNLPTPNLLGAAPRTGYVCPRGHRNFFADCGRCAEKD
jgi:hypothetical protein